MHRQGVVATLLALSLVAVSGVAFGETEGAGDYLICPGNIELPLNKVLLVREDGKVGAIVLRKSEEKKVDYEWYFPLQDGVEKMKNGTGHLEDKHFCIVGRLCFQFGTVEYQCGPIKLSWGWGKHICFRASEDTSAKSRVALSPTNASDVKAVDLQFAQRRWFTEGDVTKCVRFAPEK